MIDVRRAADRFRTVAEGRETFHSFSFGDHYDPRNVGLGAMTAYNDEHLHVGGGYPDHAHHEVEIVTVLLAGTLHHDSDVGRAELRAGDAQRLTAGTGVRHAETAGAGAGARYVQAWLRPRRGGAVPAYALERGALRTVGDGPLPTLGTAAAATLHLGRLPAGRTTRLPRSSRLHVHLVHGRGRLVPGGADPVTVLEADDVARATDEGTLELTAQSDVTLLVWDLHDRGDDDAGPPAQAKAS